ncbi:uncharacterized protein LOC128889844 [Hylaeus anthracinus]|uniref:uncharacterized protein LOC128889844 n=1 Tax=Hylaeus anthracinus TaxID=313031 RepID=UPI0023B9CDE7|nr:uncharacterized protein LOC128889844 [Hylaeus anthracinus]
MKQFMSVDQSRVYKEENNDYTENLRKVSPTSLSCVSTEEALSKTKLNIGLTDKGLQLYGTWNRTKLLKLITHKLKQCIRDQLSSKRFLTDPTNNRRLWITIQSGLYSTYVLKTLQKKGMSVHTIIKAMKLGLLKLNRCEVFYFKSFNVDPYILQFQDMWSRKFSDELISSLRSTGLSESECWYIIVHGIELQNSHILCQLMLSGIDVPGIINWRSPVNHASPKIIKFLKHIGIEESIIQLVEQYGIDEETEQILIDIGFYEMEEKCSNLEEILCECSFTMLDSDTNSLEMIQNICEVNHSRSITTPTDTLDYFQQCPCLCHLVAEKNTVEELSVQRNDYLRQNIMVPVSWTMAKVLNYKPSDPIHYMAYQLLRWKNNNVTQNKKDTIHNIIALATTAMDRKLILRRLSEEEKLLERLNDEAIKNTPCTICKEYQKLHRIKQRCWRCSKNLAKKYEICKFPQMCNSCEIDEKQLEKYDICEFSQMCSSCIINEIDKNTQRKYEICQFPRTCSSCKINEAEKITSREYEICEFPQTCTSCKINKVDKIMPRKYENCEF